MNTQRKLIVAMSLCAAVVIPNSANSATIIGIESIIDTVGNCSTATSPGYICDVNSIETNSLNNNETASTSNTVDMDLYVHDSGPGVTYRFQVANSGGTSEYAYTINLTHDVFRHLFSFNALLKGPDHTNVGQPYLLSFDGPEFNPLPSFLELQTNHYWKVAELEDKYIKWLYGDLMDWGSYRAKGLVTLNMDIPDCGVSEAFGCTNNFGGIDGYTFDLTFAAPIPPAIWLFGSGLIGLIGISRKRKH